MTHTPTEASISRKTTITLALAISVTAAAVGVTWKAFAAFDDLKTHTEDTAQETRDAIRDLRHEIAEQNYASARRIEKIEGEMDRRSADRWTSAMMEIWVLRSRESGVLEDPAPIMQRHAP